MGIHLVNVNQADRTNMLEVLDELRGRVERGEVVCYCAVGITPDDTALGWTAALKGVSRLRVQGAIAELLHSYCAGWNA